MTLSTRAAVISKLPCRHIRHGEPLKEKEKKSFLKKMVTFDLRAVWEQTSVVPNIGVSTNFLPQQAIFCYLKKPLVLKNIPSLNSPHKAWIGCLLFIYFSLLVSILAEEYYRQELEPEIGNEMEIVNKRGKQFKEAGASKNCYILQPRIM